MPKVFIFFLCSFLAFFNSTQANIHSPKSSNSHYKTGLITREASPISISTGLAFREWDSQVSHLEDNGKSLSGLSLKLDYELSNYISVFTKATQFHHDTNSNAPYSVSKRPTEISRKDLVTAITLAPWKKRFTPYIYTGISYFKYSSKEYASVEQPDVLINKENKQGLLAVAGLGIRLMTKYLFWELELTTDNSTHLGFRELKTDISIGIAI